MDEPLEDVYFNWLYTKVAAVENSSPSLSYFSLLRDLHSVEFTWLLSGDDNRAADGIELRKEFLRQARIDSEDADIFIQFECSVLEMLIAFSRRAEWQTSATARQWFWMFIENLGLAELNDANYGPGTSITPVMEQFIFRTYEPSGLGGMFPLRHTDEDQRKVEIWYQFARYIHENEID